MMKRMACLAMTIGALTGCATPKTSVLSGSERPSLRLIGAPAESVLLLDGQPMGVAHRFDGVTGILAVEEGPHTVEVINGGTSILKMPIFAASGEVVSVDVLNPGLGR
jgi:hypothetical protein